MGGGHDEREQTLNQLLVEMDGFDGNDGVIVVAATNRPEMIDPALIRSGRFERVLHVPPPDSKAIKEIFSIHTQGMPLGKFNLSDISKKMSGYTGADVESVCREAALTAMRESKKTVTKKHFETALGMVRPTVNDDMLEYFKKMESLLVSGLSTVRRGKDTQRGMESV